MIKLWVFGSDLGRVWYVGFRFSDLFGNGVRIFEWGSDFFLSFWESRVWNFALFGMEGSDFCSVCGCEVWILEEDMEFRVLI